MSAAKHVLAFDAGGGSVRMQLVGFDGGRLSMDKVARFDNGPIKAGESLYWDMLGIFKALKQALKIASHLNMELSSLGIDTWGNDFALVDKKGCMIENPYCYRDKRTAGMVEYVNCIIGGRKLFERNGIQQVRMNTMYQLASLAKDRQYLFEFAEKLMFIPDLLIYYLSGEQYSEYTMATISQLYSYDSGDWDFELMDKLEVPRTLFLPIVMPGTPVGEIKPAICSEDGIKRLKIIAVGSHDTGSAVAAVPADEDRPLYISSGTWSIIGTETEKPVINAQAYEFNCSNEGGVNGKIRLLKNVMGLWIMQEVQRKFAAEGRRYTFEELGRLAAESPPFGPVIDPDDESFYEPSDMPEMIRNYCKKTGQPVPADDGSMARTVLESLAFKYRYVIDGIERLTGKIHDKIYVVGGGSDNAVLNKFTAGCTGKTLYAGPPEATALGNALAQLVSLGEISDYKQARMIIRNSFPPAVYFPQDTERWNSEYERFLEVTGLKKQRD